MPQEPEPHKIEDDLASEVEWTDRDEAYMRLQAEFADWLQRQEEA